MKSRFDIDPAFLRKSPPMHQPPFDSQTMLDYEDFMEAYDREPMPPPLVLALILRDVFDNASCEAIVGLGESGELEACALLEELETKAKNADLRKWLRVARVRCGGYAQGNVPSG
jgi:hypothetical protein